MLTHDTSFWGANSTCPVQSNSLCRGHTQPRRAALHRAAALKAAMPRVNQSIQGALMLSRLIHDRVAARSPAVAARLLSTAPPPTCPLAPAKYSCGSTGHVHGPQCLLSRHVLQPSPSHTTAAQQHQSLASIGSASPRTIHTSSAALIPPSSCGTPGHIHGPHCAHMPRALHPGYVAPYPQCIFVTSCAGTATTMPRARAATGASCTSSHP